MNDFEQKLRSTPLRQPPTDLRDQILGSLKSPEAGDADQTPRITSETSPPRVFSGVASSPTRRKSNPLLAFLLKPTSIFCLFILTVVATGTALFVGANSVVQTSWERYCEEARARGVKMSLKELLPEPIPDAENFAAVPVFANLFSQTEAVQKEQSGTLDLNFPQREKEAQHSNFSSATLCRLEDWQASFLKTRDLSTASADPAADVLRAIEHRFGSELAELADAERRPHAVFPVKWELGYMAQLPHLSLIQKAARVHSLRMSAHLARNDVAAAYAELHGLLRLYRALEKEPTLISGLVRSSVMQLAVSGVWEGVVSGRWDATSLEKIQGDLAGFDLLSDALFAFCAERAWMNDAMNDVRSGKIPFGGAEMGLGTEPTQQMLLRLIPKIPSWTSLNQIAMNRFYDQFPARIDVSAARFYDTGETDAELQAINGSVLKQHIYVLYRTMIPAITTVEKKFLHTHTALQLSALACALERCRIAEGAYPETLASLVPRYVSTLPHDVMTGEPLHYRRTDDGRFLLYSVAMNGIDDGGAIGKKQSDHSQLDWAWRWPAP